MTCNNVLISSNNGCVSINHYIVCIEKIPQAKYPHILYDVFVGLKNYILFNFFNDLKST